MTLCLFIAVVLINIPSYVMLYGTFFRGFLRELGHSENRWEFNQFRNIHLFLFLLCSISWTIACYFMIAKFLFGFTDPWAFLR